MSQYEGNTLYRNTDCNGTATLIFTATNLYRSKTVFGKCKIVSSHCFASPKHAVIVLVAGLPLTILILASI